MLPTLYGKASTGKIKQWSVTTEGAFVIVSHGQLGGKIQHDKTESTPKNIGKSNETTGAEQALLEAQSKWNKQIKKDYRESVEEIPESTLPNLASKYEDKSHTIDWGNAWELPKLDGVRGSSFYKEGNQILQSRGGEEYPVIAEIAEELDKCFFNEYPDAFVDGELYCHGMFLEDITACVKKHNKDTVKIKLHVFDFLTTPSDDQGWYDRYNNYITLLSKYHQEVGSMEASRIQPVFACEVESEAAMLSLHQKYVDHGFEGIIVRDANAKYNFGNRTTGIIKYKVPESEEFKVLRFETSKRGEGTPWCEYTKPDGTLGEFKAPVATTIERRRFYAENPELFVGKHLTVDFEKYSKYGKPTKPIGKAFREVDLDGKAKQ